MAAEPERDPSAVSEFVERFAGELEHAGVQRMSSRVFAALLASDDGSLTSAELSERLQISPAAVSTAVRYLTQVGMVRREREPGSRRERYRLYNEVWYEMITRRDALLDRWRRVLLDGVEALGKDSPAGVRVAESAEFFDFMQRELPLLMERWREHRSSWAPADER